MTPTSKECENAQDLLQMQVDMRPSCTGQASLMPGSLWKPRMTGSGASPWQVLARGYSFPPTTSIAFGKKLGNGDKVLAPLSGACPRGSAGALLGAYPRGGTRGVAAACLSSSLCATCFKQGALLETCLWSLVVFVLEATPAEQCLCSGAQAASVFLSHS